VSARIAARTHECRDVTEQEQKPPEPDDTHTSSSPTDTNHYTNQRHWPSCSPAQEAGPGAGGPAASVSGPPLQCARDSLGALTEPARTLNNGGGPRVQAPSSPPSPQSVGKPSQLGDQQPRGRATRAVRPPLEGMHIGVRVCKNKLRPIAGRPADQATRVGPESTRATSLTWSMKNAKRKVKDTRTRG
ncbi:Hypothetical predicted protein, partial [Olea europaea subsp. europaea]